MPDLQQHEGGAAVTESSASDAEKTVKTSIDPKDHERAISDLMKEKNARRDAESKLNELKSKAKVEEQEKLKQKDMYKELAERLEKENHEKDEKLKKFQTSFIHTHKFEAVRAAAIRAGIRPEAEGDLEMLDLNDLPHELTTSGRTIISGADDFVSTIRKTKPHWFQDTTQMKFNPGGAGSKDEPESNLSLKDIQKLKFEDPAKHKELLEKYVQKKTRSK